MRNMRAAMIAASVLLIVSSPLPAQGTGDDPVKWSQLPDYGK